MNLKRLLPSPKAQTDETMKEMSALKRLMSMFTPRRSKHAKAWTRSPDSWAKRKRRRKMAKHSRQRNWKKFN